jgi:hypothetical protein
MMPVTHASIVNPEIIRHIEAADEFAKRSLDTSEIQSQDEPPDLKQARWVKAHNEFEVRGRD